MDKDELNRLIKQLEDLQIQQEAVIKKIRAAGVSTEEMPQSVDRPTHPSAPQQENEGIPFRAGQRVLIKNRLSHTPFVGRKTSIKACTVIQYFLPHNFCFVLYFLFMSITDNSYFSGSEFVQCFGQYQVRDFFVYCQA